MLYDSVFDNDPTYGGTQLLILGPKGSRKSTIMRRMAREALQHGETVVWRAKDVDNWSVFLTTNEVNVIVPGSNVDISHIPISDQLPKLQRVLYSEIEDPRTIIDNLDPKRINVIITAGAAPQIQAAWWTIFWHSLIMRKSNEWISIFMDEIDEIFPAYPDDDWWHITNQAVNYFVSFRKSNVNLRASCHDPSDVFAHLRHKFKFIGYLRGSSLVPKSVIRKKSLVANLELDKMALTSGGEFEIVEFPKTSKRLLPAYNDKVYSEWDFDPYSDLQYTRILDIDPRMWAICQNIDCGYTWQCRRTEPAICPRCRSKRWNGEYMQMLDNPVLTVLGTRPLKLKSK